MMLVSWSWMVRPFVGFGEWVKSREVLDSLDLVNIAIVHAIMSYLHLVI